MRKWLVLLLFLGLFFFPFSARAQSGMKLASFQVQLWPEYDQPSMLVIYDFKLQQGPPLPVDFSIQIPKDANLVAVASQSSDGNSLLNADYTGPETTGETQTVTVKIQANTVYHIEYYEPLSRNESVRQFSYTWPGNYAVDDFKISVRVPVDTTNITTDPILDTTQGADGSSYLSKDFGPFEAGKPFTLSINYTKSSNNLSVSPQNVQPSEPLSANTPGRVMISNYIPYILGGVGMVLIFGGLVYFWQSSRGKRSTGRRRHASKDEGETESDVYCHQCGARAYKGDRFCRVCGTKLRTEK